MPWVPWVSGNPRFFLVLTYEEKNSWNFRKKIMLFRDCQIWNPGQFLMMNLKIVCRNTVLMEGNNPYVETLASMIR